MGYCESQMLSLKPSLLMRASIPPRVSSRLGILSLALSLIPGSLAAAGWPQWRGPNFDGSAIADNLPTTFSRTENVLWSVPLPGAAASTPAVGTDRIFLSSTDQRTTGALPGRRDRRRALAEVHRTRHRP